MTCYAGNTTPTTFNTGTAATTNAPWRGWCSTGATVNGAANGNTMTASGATSGTFNPAGYLGLGGSWNAIQYVDGVVKQVCREPVATRCR